jgi:thioredoxin 1
MIFLYILLGLFALGLGYMLFSYKKLKTSQVEASKDVITLTQSNYVKSVQGTIALIDFWADWCMPCKLMAPILNEVATEVKDYANICKLNVDQEQGLAQQFGVRSIPTLVLMKNGKEVKRFVGVQNKGLLIKEINNLR